MKRLLLLPLLLLSFWVCAQTTIANSEPSKKRVTVYTKDGILYRGTITRRDSISLTIRRRDGTFSVIPLDEINRIETGKARRKQAP